MFRAGPPPESPDRQLLLDDPNRSRSVFELLYNVARIDIRRSEERRFLWNWRLSSRGPVTIIRGQAQTGAATLAGTPSHFVLLTVAAGAIEIASCGRRFAVVPDRTAAIVSASTEVEASAGGGSQTLNIRIDPGALASHAAALAGAPVDTPLRFDPDIDLCGDAGASVLRLARLLEEASARPDTPLGSPHVLAHLREALYGALLVGQKSTLHHLFHRPPRAVHRRAVQQAEEILAARAAEPISIAELAELTGVGLRSLERSFKAARGCSLRDFLKARRLDLAHLRLRSATPGMTVTQVLYASGFSHPGEFSLAYRKRFGEAPSQTLRRASGGGLLQLG